MTERDRETARGLAVSATVMPRHAWIDGVALLFAEAREEGRREERARCVAICRNSTFHEGQWLANSIEGIEDEE